MRHAWTFAALAATLAGCGGPGTQPATQAGTQPGTQPATQAVSRFVGRYDAPSRTLSVGMVPLDAGEAEVARALSEIPVNKNGDPNSGPPGTVKLITTATGQGSGACGVANSYCGEVQMKSLFPSSRLANIHAQIDSMTPGSGFNSYNSVAPPSGSGLSATYGLWRYPDITSAGATSTQGGGFNLPSVQSFTFSGRVFADVTAGTSITYSPQAQFTGVANPAGVWSYGWRPTTTGAFTLLAAHSVDGYGESRWNTTPVDQYLGVYRNDSGGVVTVGGSNVPPGQLFLHPGGTPGPPDQKAALRFTAPGAATYQLQYSFTTITLRPNSTDTTVLINGAVVWASGVNSNGGGPTASNTITQPLAAGDTVDFQVGFGTDGNNFNDATGLDLTITQM